MEFLNQSFVNKKSKQREDSYKKKTKKIKLHENPSVFVGKLYTRVLTCKLFGRVYKTI